MMEAEWSSCTDPAVMLRYLRAYVPVDSHWGALAYFATRPLRLRIGLKPRASARKLRLIACACFRDETWVWVRDDYRGVFDVAERYADDEASDEEVRLVKEKLGFSFVFGDPCPFVSSAVMGDGSGQTGRRKAAIIREIIGNPFRPVTLPASVRAWNNGLVGRLSEEAYQQRMPDSTLDPARLAVLTDALEEAGADAALVAHLREPSLHWRGCHALDALLGRA